MTERHAIEMCQVSLNIRRRRIHARSADLSAWGAHRWAIGR